MGDHLGSEILSGCVHYPSNASISKEIPYCTSLRQSLAMETITVRLQEPGHLEEDYEITTFFENKGFSSFFVNGPIKFKV